MKYHTKEEEKKAGNSYLNLYFAAKLGKTHYYNTKDNSYKCAAIINYNSRVLNMARHYDHTAFLRLTTR